MNSLAPRLLLGVLVLCLAGCSTLAKKPQPWSIQLAQRGVLETRVNGIVAFSIEVVGDEAKSVEWEWEGVPDWLNVYPGADMVRVTGLVPPGTDEESPLEPSFTAIGANGERRTFGPIELRISPALAEEIYDKGAYSYASEQGYSLTANLRDYADRAAEEIEQLPQVQQEREIRRAKANFQMLTDAMIRAAGDDDVLGEDDFEKALWNICPLWPFCD